MTWDRIPQGIIDKATNQWKTQLHAYVGLECKGTSLGTPTVI